MRPEGGLKKKNPLGRIKDEDKLKLDKLDWGIKLKSIYWIQFFFQSANCQPERQPVDTLCFDSRPSEPKQMFQYFFLSSFFPCPP